MTSLLTNELCLFNSQGRRVFARALQRQKWRSGGVAEWLKAADCKSARVAYVGSNPTPTTIVGKRGVITGDTLLFRCELRWAMLMTTLALTL